MAISEECKTLGHEGITALLDTEAAIHALHRDDWAEVRLLSRYVSDYALRNDIAREELLRLSEGVGKLEKDKVSLALTDLSTKLENFLLQQVVECECKRRT